MLTFDMARRTIAELEDFHHRRQARRSR